MREFKVFVRATNDIADTPISGAAMGMAATTTTTTMTMAAVPGVGGDLSTSTAGWTEVLHSGLRNDSEPECFPLQYPIRQIPLDDTGEEEEEEQRQQQQQQQLISSFHPSPSPSLVSYWARTRSRTCISPLLTVPPVFIGSIAELSIDAGTLRKDPAIGRLGQQLQLLHMACGAERSK